MKLKALEILESLLFDVKKDISANSLDGVEVFGYIETNIEEAIKELKQYEQNFKQKEFEYRTECQKLVSAGRVEADEIAKGRYIDSKKSTNDNNQMIGKLEKQSTFYKLVGYESDGRE